MSAAPGDDPTLRRSLARWQRSGSVIGLALVLAFPIYLGVERTRRDEALVSRQQAMSALGGELWAQNCASCHGINGEGVDAPALNSQQFFEGTDPRQIHHLTASGVPGTEMPAWWVWMGGSLTDEQISAIVAYVLSWQESARIAPTGRPRAEPLRKASRRTGTPRARPAEAMRGETRFPMSQSRPRR